MEWRIDSACDSRRQPVPQQSSKPKRHYGKRSHHCFERLTLKLVMAVLGPARDSYRS